MDDLIAFSNDEKKTLLEAYNENGYQIFHNYGLLKKYFPNREENELKHLIDRLKNKHITTSGGTSGETSNLERWLHLANQSSNALSRTKKVNLDHILADTLNAMAEPDSETNQDTKPNYPKLLRSFSQLLSGKFPDDLTPANAQISMRLFSHLTYFVGSVNLDSALGTLRDGTWLESALEEDKHIQAKASLGLSMIDGAVKKCPTNCDLEQSSDIEALCLELPKIRRITDVLNPLRVTSSMTGELVNLFNETST